MKYLSGRNALEKRYIFTNIAEMPELHIKVLTAPGRTTASRLSNAGIPLEKIRDILGQIDEKTPSDIFIIRIWNKRT